MTTPDPGGRPSAEADAEVRRRIEQLERENARLKRQMAAVFGPDNPCFDRAAFQRALQFYMLAVLLPLQLAIVPAVVLLGRPGLLPHWMIGPITVFDFGGVGTTHPGFGLGVVAFGGLAVGVLAVGGGAVGLIAIGGGAVGFLAVGGGSLGVLAMGGGAVGYVAIGGGAVGRYALGGQARGKAVFCFKRQDPEAVAFFTRWFPRFKAAVTTPLPVVTLESDKEPHVQ